MPQSLSDLEQRRERIAQRIAELGDLRPGSITGTSGRCGKPECHCHHSRFVSPAIGLVWGMVVSGVLLTRSPATRAGW